MKPPTGSEDLDRLVRSFSGVQLSRDEAEKLGAHLDSVSSTRDSRRESLCWCGRCGETSVCSPSNDFYMREGEIILRCRGCLWRDL